MAFADHAPNIFIDLEAIRLRDKLIAAGELTRAGKPFKSDALRASAMKRRAAIIELDRELGEVIASGDERRISAAWRMRHVKIPCEK